MESKPLIKSKSAQGNFVAATPAVVIVLEHLGVLPPEQISPAAAAIVTLAGVAWSLFGNIVRKTKIRSILF